MNQLDFDAINLALGEADVLRWLPGGQKRGAEYVVANPTRKDSNPGSFTINLVRCVWKDFATGDAGSDFISLYAYLYHQDDQGAAAKELAGNHGVKIGDPVTRQHAADAKVANIEEARPEPIFPVPITAGAPNLKHPRYGDPALSWLYADKNGRPLLYVCRFNPPGERKQVIPLSWCKHPNGTERWTWRGITGSKKRPLYRLDSLAADPESDAILVEGEKAADAAQRLFGDTAVCTTWLGGVETADRVNINALAGRRVILWPDADALREPLTRDEANAGIDPASKPLLALHEQPGMRAMMKLAQALKGVAREVLMVGYVIDVERHGWDLADGESEGWTAEHAAQHLKTHAGDPWHIAAARAVAVEQRQHQHDDDVLGGDEVQMAHAPNVAVDVPRAVSPPNSPANDNTPPGVPLDAAVNPFGFPHMGDKGQPMNTVENLAYVLDQYGISVRYNIIRKLVEVEIPGKDYGNDLKQNCTLTEINSICSRNRMPKADAGDYIKLISSWDRYNPVEAFIKSKPWDGVSRLADLYATITTTKAYDRALMEMLVRRWLVSAAAAALRPSGFWSKGVLVLQGGQSEGKTSWFKALLPDELRSLLKVGATIDPANKDSVSSVISHWMIELGELDATFRKADVARLKSFISQDVDELRRPYDRLESEYQRRSVFFASVNPKDYLVDDTGNVRWWTISILAINPLHGIDVQQLWAEVAMLYEGGERWWLTKDEEALLEGANTEHQAPNTIEDLIHSKFDWSRERHHSMSATEVVISLGFDKPTNPQAKDVGRILRKMIGEPGKSNGRVAWKLPPLMKPGQQAFDHHDERQPF